MKFRKTALEGRGVHCKTILKLLVVASFSVALAACGDGSSSARNHEAAHDESVAEVERGPHGGRLLKDGDFEVEVAIFETGVLPTFRVFGYDRGSVLAPSDLSVEMSLTRLGGALEKFELKPSGDFLTSKQEVREPHSFEVAVSATYKDKTHTWKYESFEGRTSMPRDVAELSGVQVEHPVERMVATTRRIRGKILPSEHRIAHVIPRFSGIVREGRKHIGDRVEKGEVLAIIESNQSLQPFEIRSQIAGTVINGHLIVGEFVPENQWVYIVADLSEVWADFFVPLRDRNGIAAGQRVRIAAAADRGETEGTISYLAPYADEKSQAQLVRAVIPNQKNEFLPGMFITGDVVIGEQRVPVVVRNEAVQRFGKWSVVFVRYGDTYEARPVELGRTDGDWTEVVRGLNSNEEYVVKNSFLIKADILKSGASHDH